MENTSAYIKAYKSIKKEEKSVPTEEAFRIAILSSATIRGLKEVLHVKCHQLGIKSEIKVGEYNQYSQEIIDGNSFLYSYDPKLVILFIDTRALLGKQLFEFTNLSLDDQQALFKAQLDQLKMLISRMREKLSAKIVIHNFEVPLSSPMGILDNKMEMGLRTFVQKLNLELAATYQTDNQVFIFDFENFCSRWGKENTFDHKMYYLGDIKLSLNYFPQLGEAYLGYIKPMLSLSRKCIVLDMDNTLWGGIIGEDGLEGIRLGPTPEGRSFLEFQQYILALFNRGIILALNSKNNPDDALNVLRNHPYMILKEEHFASIQINWTDKITNMRNIAQELNIGLDSLVFFDDDHLNREMIRTALPEVKVIDLPEDHSGYLQTIMELDDFNVLQITEEDKKKGVIYAEQKQRKTLENTAVDINDYLRALDMEVTIEKANSFTIPRISQLTQKTNQFNMTTKRYLEEDIKQMSSSDAHLVFSIKVKDKFGDNGITGVSIVNKDSASWRIDSFLLSCRVIGRRVEETMLAYILNEAKKQDAKTLVGEFISTKKNLPAKDFYERNGFSLTDENNETQRWELSVANEYNFPEFINVSEK